MDTYLLKNFFAEVKDGVVRNIKIDDSYVPLHLSLPDADMNEDIQRGGMILQVIGENEEAIFNTDASVGTKIPSGTYHVQYTGTGNDASYGFFKNNVRLDQQNSTVTFSNDDVALMELTLEQKNPANYKLDHLAPLYWAGGKYDSIRHVNFEEDVNSIYLSKLEYDGIHVYYLAEKNQQQWELMFDLGQVNLQEDKEFKVSDNLMLKAEWRGHSSVEDTIDIEKPLYNYVNVYVSNDLNQRVSINKWDDHHKEPINGKIIIKANGKEFTKEVGDLRFEKVSIKDVIGDQKISGEVTLEFHVVDSPIPVKPYSQVIQLASEMEV